MCVRVCACVCVCVCACVSLTTENSFGFFLFVVVHNFNHRYIEWVKGRRNRKGDVINQYRTGRG